MKLHQIPSSKGGRKFKKRVGAGMGNPRGKTCGRGQKGSGARSGYSTHPGFEGGQMPLYRKLPHRGFNNKSFRKEYLEVNVNVLDQLDDKEITRELLIQKGVIVRDPLPLKVLGNGEINRAITVYADKFSGTAKSKIEAAGGQAILTHSKEASATSSQEE